MNKIDVLMAGVGGQGIILASDLLAEVAIAAGYDVKKSDALGMSQRGGSVVSNVRMGERVYSPLIRKGAADFLLAFEKLEAARWAGFLRDGGTAIVNDQSIPPLSVSSGLERYPGDDEVKGLLGGSGRRVYVVPGQDLASRLGDRRTLNILMMGFLSSLLPIDVKLWRDHLSGHLPLNMIELNMKAFEAGRDNARVMAQVI